jgi:hypothetical protein
MSQVFFGEFCLCVFAPLRETPFVLLSMSYHQPARFPC